MPRETLAQVKEERDRLRRKLDKMEVVLRGSLVRGYACDAEEAAVGPAGEFWRFALFQARATHGGVVLEKHWPEPGSSPQLSFY